PADGFYGFEQSRLAQRIAFFIDDRISLVVALHSSALAHIEGNARGQTLIQCIQVDVVGDEKLARADDDGAGARHKLGRAEIRDPSRVRYSARAAFVFTFANVGAIAAMRRAA